MEGSVQWAEWFVEKVAADRSLGNTTWVLAINLLALGWILLRSHNRGGSAPARDEPGFLANGFCGTMIPGG